MGDFTVTVRQKPMDFNRWQLGLGYKNQTREEEKAGRGWLVGIAGFIFNR